METIAGLTRSILRVGFLLMTIVSNVCATQAVSSDSLKEEAPFRVNVYQTPQWKMNVVVAIHRPARITITVKNPDNTVMHQEMVGRKPGYYRWKFDFEEAQAGTYRFEITNGQQTIVRQVEIVSMPAIEAQRYMVYGPQLTP